MVTENHDVDSGCHGRAVAFVGGDDHVPFLAQIVESAHPMRLRLDGGSQGSGRDGRRTRDCPEILMQRVPESPPVRSPDRRFFSSLSGSRASLVLDPSEWWRMAKPAFAISTTPRTTSGRPRVRGVAIAARRPRPTARRVAEGLGVPGLGSPGLLPLASIRGRSIEPPDVG